MDDIGVVSPELMRAMVDDFRRRQQLQPHISQNYPQRRPIDEPSPHRVFVRNDSAETCPAYGCLQITGVAVVGGMTVITIDKPSTLTGEYLFNSPYPIAAGGNGWAYRYGIVIALGNGTAPTAVNVTYQPVVSTWTIEESAGGFFTVFGEHNVATDAVIGRFDGGSLNVQHGIVTANLGCGYYTIEKAIWNGDRETAGVGLGSGSGVGDCDICYDITGENTSACAITLTYPPVQVTGTGVFVTAYDSASVLIPLVTGSSVKMINMGDTSSATGEGSGSGSDATPIWQILRGLMQHTVQYKERWDCCDGQYESGVETLIGRTPVILIGRECDEIICGTCNV